MSPETLSWVLAGHLIGLFIWVGGMFAVYWMLRLHAHAPKDVHEKLTLMERSIALVMDLGAGLAIGCGLAMAFGQPTGMPSVFTRPGGGWFHIKLTVVVLGMLPIHGMMRSRIKRFGMGEIKPVPQWQWSVFIASIAAIILLVTQGPRWFAPKADTTAPSKTEPAPAQPG